MELGIVPLVWAWNAIKTFGRQDSWLADRPCQELKRQYVRLCLVVITVAGFLPAIGSGELVIFLVLLIIGIIIILLLKAVIHFILPIVAAVIVWFVTGSLLYAGIAFVAVAILQMVIRRR